MMNKLQKIRDEVYQKMIDNAWSYRKSHVSCVTGFGKTEMFKRFITENPNDDILYVADKRVQVDNMGEMAKSVNENNAAVTYSYLSRNSDWQDKLRFIGQFSIIIFDESHLMGAHNCDKVTEYASKNYITIIGGTATPVRTEGVNVAERFFDGHNVEYGIREAYDDGFIMKPYVSTTVYLGLRINELKKKLQENKKGKWAVDKLTGIERAIAMRDTLEESVADAVEVGGRGIWIVFHPTISVLKSMRGAIDTAFKKAAPEAKSYAVSSDEDHLDVNEFMLKHSGMSIVHAVNMMTTGWHFPDISGLVINRMTDSAVVYIQQLGRAIVLGSEKQTAIVDIVGRMSSKNKKFNEILRVFTGRDESEKHEEDIVNRGSNREPKEYEVVSERRILSFESTLDAIDAWTQGHEYVMTAEEAVLLMREHKYASSQASIATGIPEDMLKEMAEDESFKCADIHIEYEK